MPSRGTWVGILIGMVLERQLAIGFLDVCVCGSVLDFKDLEWVERLGLSRETTKKHRHCSVKKNPLFRHAGKLASVAAGVRVS